MEDDLSTTNRDQFQTSADNVDSSTDQDALWSFRQQWQKELRSTKKSDVNELRQKSTDSTSKEDSSKESNNDEDIKERATNLFLAGSEMENSGKFYEAIQYYRQAVQIVPDIELIINRKIKPKAVHEEYVEDEIEETSETVNVGTSSDEDEGKDDEDLLSRIQRKASKKLTLCLPKLPKNGVHVGELPLEIILYILKWLVSDQLDLRSMEMFSQVCRGFYLCARDPEIWRMACLRMWGVNCGSSPGNYKSWRSMFIERSRVNFNGCYISKTTYIRNGENSFQDQFYRPWYLVAYYRYLRFYPDGTVLMLTSAEEPVQCINLLKHRNARYPVLTGYYRLKDDKVILIIQRQTKSSLQDNKKSKKQDMLKKTEFIYNMEFQIRSKRRKHDQLQWDHYSIVTKPKKGEETVTNFELRGPQYPPLIFSRVKSYAESSENPLM
ncbi:unnamed protein product [Phyllotreta striolata]|uniref:F-box only protein 9 n=1 Tax=Phyllotreta striolata TaxID=444603 RepID=A0A9N9TNG0_PHYSR|nr:unnamed protein product [Phyllotreta striolata]